jgi:hypothetical protein
VSKRSSTVEWVVAENEADWERLCEPLARELAPEETASGHDPLATMHHWGGVALLLAVLVSAGWWERRAGQSPALQTQAQVTVPATPRPGAGAAGRDALGVRNTGDQAANDWSHQVMPEDISLQGLPTSEFVTDDVLALTQLEFQGKHAIARVLIGQRGAPLHRQTRFYHYTPDGWRQTTPEAALWGPERRLETPSFVFHFRQRDAAVVTAAAPQIEAIYHTMRQNFGLESMPDAQKLVIQVSVTQSPPLMQRWFAAPQQIIIPSPAFYLAPIKLKDTEVLIQALALPLIEYVSLQARKDHLIPTEWLTLESALRLWQMWDLELPLSAWRVEIVQWIYSDQPTNPPRQAGVLPPRYRELCADHRIWLLSPLQINVPLFCTDQDQDRGFFFWLEAFDPPMRLTQLAVPLDLVTALSGDIPSPGLPDQAVVLATLIEYAIATYGREHLPVLVASLDQYDSWATLLPAVFGVSAAEFEAGWQEYLATQYGV